MPRIPRRKIPGLIGTSCLAAALAFPAGVATDAALSAHAGQAVVPQAQPTPPPPEPGTPEPETPEQPPPETGEPETQPPGTDEPGTPDPGTPDPGDASSTPDAPATDPEDGSTKDEQELAEDAMGEIEALDVPEEVKEELRRTVDRISDAIDDPDLSPADRKLYAEVLDHVDEMLGLLNDPKTSPEERRALVVSLQAVDEMLEEALDDDAPPAERDAYKKLTLGLTTVAARLTGEDAEPSEEDTRTSQAPPPETAPAKPPPAQGLKDTSGFLRDSLGEGTQPERPADRKAVQSAARQHAQAFVTAHGSSASDEDRGAAEKELDRPKESAEDPRYQEILDQTKEYKAPAGCISLIENRTEQAGWTTGSLWGLASDVCDRPRAAGVNDTSSKWNDLFTCVDEEPFSTCAARLPED